MDPILERIKGNKRGNCVREKRRVSYFKVVRSQERVIRRHGMPRSTCNKVAERYGYNPRRPLVLGVNQKRQGLGV